MRSGDAERGDVPTSELRSTDSIGMFDGIVRVEIDGHTVEYYPAEVEIPATTIAGVHRYEYRVDAALDHHPRLRRAVVWFRTFADVSRVFGALHWADGTDLEALDRELTADRPGNDVDGVDSTDDSVDHRFDGALFVMPSDAMCLTCHSSSLVVAVDPGLPVSSIPRRRQHPTLVNCPVCGADRFVPHLEVLQT